MPPPPPPSRPRRAHRPLWWILGSLAALMVAATVASFFVPAQWAGRLLPGHSIVDSDAVAFAPGGAIATSERVKADGVEVFEPEGEILLLTVSVDSEVTVAEWLRSVVDDSIELRTRESVYGDRSQGQQRDHNRDLMESAKDVATIAALERLGVHAVDFTGVLFAETVSGGPADGLLEATDVIRAVGNEEVTTVDALLAVLAALEPGDSTVVTVENADTHEPRDVELVLGVHPDHGGAFLGVSGVRDRVERPDLPFDIDISSGAVGGPSAGLAFALTVLDILTPGEMTGGERIAVTGSIRLDGTVGDVGGVAQKAEAARRAGATLIIVPAALVNETRSGAGDVPVVGVATLDEALQALAVRGGDPVGRLQG